MTSQKQVQANRANAKQSTGPKTDQGKMVVSKNAVRHGILSHASLLASEPVESLEQLTTQLWTHLRPVGSLEEVLVDKIVAVLWRLRRVMQAEAALFTLKSEHTHAEAQQAVDSDLNRTDDEVIEINQKIQELLKSSDLLLAQASDMPKSPHDLNLELKMRAIGMVGNLMALFGIGGEETHEEDHSRIGEAFKTEAGRSDAFTKLARYESALNREFYRALHELQRLQAMRSGQVVPLPIAVDVDLGIHKS